jgi:CHAT domain-containing protein/tetratricopeptide (TPR) repeat protein
LSFAKSSTTTHEIDTLSYMLFSQEKYDRAVNLIDNYIISYNGVKDSDYIELLKTKALSCFHIKAKRDLSISTMEEAIRIAEKLPKYKDKLAMLYDDYLHLSDGRIEKSKKGLIHDYLFKLFKTNNYPPCIYKFLEDYYLGTFFSPRDWSTRKGDIQNDMNLYNVKENATMQAFFKYIIGGNFSNGLPEATSTLLEAISEFEKIGGDKPLECLLRCYESIAEIYNYANQNETALIYYKKGYKLLQINWKRWGEHTPWSYDDWEPLATFKTYVYCLSDMRRYSDIVSLCDQVLSSKDTATLANEQIEYIKGIKNKFNSDSVETETSEDDDYDNFETYDSLMDHKNYIDLIKLISKSCQNIRKEFKLDRPLTLDIFEKLDIVIKGDLKVSNYEKEITYERSDYFHSNGSKVMYNNYYFLAWAYFNSGNVDKAIEIQYRFLDFARTDWRIESDTRKLILSHKYSQFFDDFEYIDREIDVYLDLCYFLFKAGRFSEATPKIRNVIDLCYAILAAQFHGSQMYKEKVWNEYRDRFIYLKDMLSDFYPQCETLSLYILEVSTVTKGFILNMKTAVRDIVSSSSNIKVKDVFKKINHADYDLEQSYYLKKNVINTDSLELVIANNDAILDSIIDIKNIIAHSSTSIDFLKSHLSPKDIAVDFFTINTNKSFQKEDSLNEQYFVLTKYQEKSMYASIYRTSWEYPLIVNIGSNKEIALCMSIKDASKINSLYSSETLTGIIWGKIIKGAKIEKGENIYFVPSEFINQLAIESLPIGNDSIISEKYNIYRLSSFRQIQFQKAHSKGNGQIVALGNLDYKSKAINQNVNLLCDNLSTLPSTEMILNHLQNLYTNNIIRLEGENATENVFKKFDGHSPAIIHVGTHGFNRTFYAEDKKVENYLTGGRNMNMSNENKAMYLTGLYMTQTKEEDIPTNGLLTSKEVSMLDLSNTELVVLSACSSAIGYNTIEGVYGLPRGFKLAGVNGVIASLWDVDDKATGLLIKYFYQELHKGENVYQALQNSKRELRNYVDNSPYSIGDLHIYKSPYYWASFILIDGL